MAISVVQVSNSSGVFASGVTAGNSIILIPFAYEFSNVTLTSSAPTLGGSAFTGAVDVLDVPSGFSTGSGVVYGGFWLLKNITAGQAGQTSLGITIGSGGTLFALYGIEIAGGGTNPVLDVAAVSGANGNSADPTAGPTAAITGPDLVVGFGIMLSVALASPTGGWTATAGPSNFAWLGYQSGSSGTFTWAQSSSSSTNAWSAGVITIKATAAAAAATPAPLVVPQAAVMQAANW